MTKHKSLKALPGTVSLLKGDSSFEKDAEISRIKTSLDERGFGFEEYDLPGDLMALESALYTRGLFASKKAILVTGAESLRKKGDRSILIKYAQDTQKDVILLLRTADRKKVSAWIEKEVGPDEVVELDNPSKWELGSWVKDRAQAIGLQLPASYAEAIVMNVGEDLYALQNELEKIKVYCDGRTKVKQQDIEAVLFQHTSVSPFDVVKLWGLKEKAAGVRYFLNLLENTPRTEWTGVELVVLGALQDRVEALLRAKAYDTDGLRGNQIADKLGVNSWVYRNNVEPQLKARNVFELEAAYIHLAELEALIKTGRPGYLLLESFLATH